MPGFDGTGPVGAGPMTGGARGYCNTPGSAYGGPFGYGRGMGYGRGFMGRYGRGGNWRRRFWRRFSAASDAPVYRRNPEDELSMLRKEADAVKNSLDFINNRIVELENADI